MFAMEFCDIEFPWLGYYIIPLAISFAIITAFLGERYKELKQFTVSGLCTSFPLRLVELVCKFTFISLFEILFGGRG